MIPRFSFSGSWQFLDRDIRVAKAMLLACMNIRPCLRLSLRPFLLNEIGPRGAGGHRRGWPSASRRAEQGLGEQRHVAAATEESVLCLIWNVRANWQECLFVRYVSKLATSAQVLAMAPSGWCV